MTVRPFETAEEALYWAVEFSKRRHSPRAFGLFDHGKNRPCEIVDVFNGFRTAYLEKKIDKLQYTIFLYAKKYGDLPPEPWLFPMWRKMMKDVEPLLAKKGIVVRVNS